MAVSAWLVQTQTFALVIPDILEKIQENSFVKLKHLQIQNILFTGGHSALW